MKLRGKRPTLILAGQSQTSSLAPPQSGRSEGSKHGDKARMNRDFFPCSGATAACTPVWQSYLVLTYSWRTDTPRLYPLLLCMDMVPKAKTSCRSGGVWYGCLLCPSRSGVLMFWKKDALSSCRATPKWRSRPNTPTGPLALLAAAAHAWLAQVDLPWPLFAADIKVTPLGLSQYWDDGLAMRVQQALAAFAFPAYQYPPPKPFTQAIPMHSLA